MFLVKSMVVSSLWFSSRSYWQYSILNIANFLFRSKTAWVQQPQNIDRLVSVLWINWALQYKKLSLCHLLVMLNLLEKIHLQEIGKLEFWPRAFLRREKTQLHWVHLRQPVYLEKCLELCPLVEHACVWISFIHLHSFRI